MSKYLVKRDLIYDFMMDHNLCTSEFCKVCRISPLTLAKLLLNDFNLDTANVVKICKVINFPLNELFCPDFEMKICDLWKQKKMRGG